MKIFAIGDIHGKTVWQDAVSRIEADVIVFVGDYINAKRWLFNKFYRENLATIINFKKQKPEHVRLLIGNHDLPFVVDEQPLRKVTSPKLYRLYADHRHLFSVAYQHNHYLFSHAGITQGWYDRHKQLIEAAPGDSLASKLNGLLYSANSSILKERGRARGGTYEHGGIIYADKQETRQNGIPGYVQIVGHSKVIAPVVSNFAEGSMIYIDCLNNVTEFLHIDDHIITAINLHGQKRKINSI